MARTRNQDTAEAMTLGAFLAFIVVSHVGVKLRERMRKKS